MLAFWWFGGGAGGGLVNCDFLLFLRFKIFSILANGVKSLPSPLLPPLVELSTKPCHWSLSGDRQ